MMQYLTLLIIKIIWSVILRRNIFILQNISDLNFYHYQELYIGVISIYKGSKTLSVKDYILQHFHFHFIWIILVGSNSQLAKELQERFWAKFIVWTRLYALDAWHLIIRKTIVSYSPQTQRHRYVWLVEVVDIFQMFMK